MERLTRKDENGKVLFTTYKNRNDIERIECCEDGQVVLNKLAEYENRDEVGCRYCNNKEIENGTWLSYDTTGYGKIWNLKYYNDCSTNEICIEYCPMCGRRLDGMK